MDDENKEKDKDKGKDKSRYDGFNVCKVISLLGGHLCGTSSGCPG